MVAMSPNRTMFPRLNLPRPTCILALVASLSPAGAQEAVTNLSCSGQVEFATDGRREVKRSSVNVALDLQAQVVEISDVWGCVLDFAVSSGLSEGLSCNGRLPVSVSEREITFSREQASTKYATRTVFTLNRYSGSLTVNSLAIALPESRATWKSAFVTASFVCSSQQRRF